MSVRVRGTLVISRKHGRRGDFNVGQLSCDIGDEFEIKDALIEEFEPGKYTGEFIIRWIEPDPIMWRGRVFVKNRVTLDEIVIDEADETADTTPSLPPEPDPIELPAAKPAAPDARREEPRPKAPKSTPARVQPQDETEGDRELFGGEIYDAITSGTTVRLDPSVDRELFRRQRDRMKALGYRFNSMEQSWAKQPAEATV